ncbi:MAG: hypothetical protein KGH75_01435 [Rhodospirillales bacterium]|nr:hypothetical protein [Rhodospirillales bacterium]
MKKGFLEKAKKDKRVIALFKALRNGSYTIDLKGLEKEVDTLHITRQVRKLKTEELLQSFQKRFTDAALENQAYRSRLVEIKVKCYRVSAKLEEHIKVIKGYLASQYPNSLSKYRTASERRQAIDSVLEEPLTFLAKLAMKDKEIELIIKDLDQSAWAMKDVLGAANLNLSDKSAKF